jgi:hypothetical protein
MIAHDAAINLTGEPIIDGLIVIVGIVAFLIFLITLG